MGPSTPWNTSRFRTNVPLGTGGMRGETGRRWTGHPESISIPSHCTPGNRQRTHVQVTVLTIPPSAKTTVAP
jgi:hypothetical protein